MIGEFNGWAADEWMTRNMDAPDEWSAMIVFTRPAIQTATASWK